MKRRGPGLFIGTSGWNYRHWAGGVFYPAGLKPAEWLSFYARRFSTVEVNYSFYRLPSPRTFAAWRDAVPDGFVFALKVSRFATHRKKLADPEAALGRFLEHASALGPKLGPLLFQLPPWLGADPGRLEGLLAYLERQTLVPAALAVFEFRHASWFAPEILGILERHGAALCLADWPAFGAREPGGAAAVYVRRHGPGEPYASAYGRERLRALARRIRVWLREGRTVFCYFNNDAGGAAVADARILQELCGGAAPRR